MERLTGNLLKIVRLDAKTISFEKKPCDVGGLVKDAAEGFITRAEKEGKQLFLEGEETILNCDRNWTEEAVSNLIKNALDHTDEGDFVKISWEKSPVMIRISVEDNGSGISEEDIYHIFKRFYRSSSFVFRGFRSWASSCKSYCGRAGRKSYGFPVRKDREAYLCSLFRM